MGNIFKEHVMLFLEVTFIIIGLEPSAIKYMFMYMYTVKGHDYCIIIGGVMWSQQVTKLKRIKLLRIFYFQM